MLYNVQETNINQTWQVLPPQKIEIKLKFLASTLSNLD